MSSERYHPYPRPSTSSSSSVDGPRPSTSSSSVDGYCLPHQAVPPRRTPRMRISYAVTTYSFQLPQWIIDESNNEEEEEEEEEGDTEEELTTTGDGEDMSECYETRTYWYDPVEDGDEEEEVCSICLVEYEDEETVATLQCGHEYHQGCIKKWLREKKTCPFCRESVRPHGVLSSEKKKPESPLAKFQQPALGNQVESRQVRRNIRLGYKIVRVYGLENRILPVEEDAKADGTWRDQNLMVCTWKAWMMDCLKLLQGQYFFCTLMNSRMYSTPWSRRSDEENRLPEWAVPPVKAVA